MHYLPGYCPQEVRLTYCASLAPPSFLAFFGLLVATKVSRKMQLECRTSEGVRNVNLGKK
jgi:hypothetical protein